jgi:flagellar biosynthesis/type III secretory pathway protein FliH
LRGDRYYETNEYGAEVLRQAVNSGYGEGFRAGQADREDGWRSSYRDSYAYQDASFGYTGHYVDPDEYCYYFREGFQHGYKDGYRSRFRYGSYVDGKYTILAAVLAQILDLQPLN